MIRDESIYATMEEIEQFLRGDPGFPTEEQTNSSELRFASSEVTFHSSELLFRPFVAKLVLCADECAENLRKLAQLCIVLHRFFIGFVLKLQQKTR